MENKTPSVVDQALSGSIKARSGCEKQTEDPALNQYKLLSDAMNKELNMLAYAISHDLEQPLRHIMAYSKLLSRKISEHEDPDIQKFAEFIQSAGVVMDARISAILDYSRLSQHPVSYKSVDTKKRIQAIFGKYKIEADMRKLDFQLQEMPVILTDSYLFDVIFHALLKNALYFTSQAEKPAITVAGKKTPTHTIISVKDNGVGMGEHTLERMVRLFQQGEGGLPKLPTSHGVGLTMAQRAVNMLEGKLSHSVSAHQETCFHVHFPH